jgi:hypothetical protein
MLTHFLNNWLTDGGAVVSLTSRPHFIHGGFLLLLSVRDWVDATAIVLLEGLGQLKNLMTSTAIESATFRLAV